MSDKQAVIDEDPASSKSKEPAPGGGKKSPLNPEDYEAKLAELTDALKKKDSAIEDLRGKVDEYKDQLEERLQELQEKSRLTNKEENEIETLEKQISDIERHQYGRALTEKMKRVSSESTTEAEKRIDFKLAKEWVEETAEELKLDPKKFEERLVARFAGGRWGDKSLRQRVKLAWKEIQYEESLKKEKEDLEKKKIEFSETGGKLPRGEAHRSAVDLAKEGKVRDALDSIYETQIKQQQARLGR